MLFDPNPSKKLQKLRYRDLNLHVPGTSKCVTAIPIAIAGYRTGGRLRLILKWFANPYFAYFASTRPCKSRDLQCIVHDNKVLENIPAKPADLAR